MAFFTRTSYIRRSFFVFLIALNTSSSVCISLHNTLSATESMKTIKTNERSGRMAKLTAKQQRFVDEYLIDCNATQAAIRAGYSTESAKVIGCENLTKPNIAEAIQKRMSEKEQESIMSQDEVLKHLTSIGRGEPQEYSSENTKSKNGVETTTISTGSSTPQTEERLRAIELIGKRYGMFTDKLQAEVTESVQFVDDIE